MYKQLIDDTLEQIKKDISCDDVEYLKTLLELIPEDNLKLYLLSKIL